MQHVNQTDTSVVTEVTDASHEETDFNTWLKSDDHAALYTEIKTFSIMRHISGTLSLVASITLVWILLRSHVRLSTTTNRLLFALCVADIMSSSAHVFSSFVAPKELNYLVWNAHGNVASCEASGFFQFMGMNLGMFYNASLCFNYLAIVRYNKRPDYIRDKIEPWFHGVSIIFSLVVSIIPLIKNYYNFAQTCLPNAYDPKHCEGYEDGIVPDGYTIPCGRGGTDSAGTTYFIPVFFPVLFALPVIIIVTMSLMYRTVVETENKLKKYGRSTLALKTGNVRNTTDTSLKPRGPEKKSRSNLTRGGGSRAVMNKAFAYSMAWLLTYGTLIVLAGMLLGNASIPKGLIIIYTLTLPLQGIMNLFIYISPRVLSAKRSKKVNLSWRQALMKGLTSRGERKLSRSLTSSNISRRGSGVISNLINRFGIVMNRQAINKKLKFNDASESDQSVRKGFRSSLCSSSLAKSGVSVHFARNTTEERSNALPKINVGTEETNNGNITKCSHSQNFVMDSNSLEKGSTLPKIEGTKHNNVPRPEEEIGPPLGFDVSMEPKIIMRKLTKTPVDNNSIANNNVAYVEEDGILHQLGISTDINALAITATETPIENRKTTNESPRVEDFSPPIEVEPAIKSESMKSPSSSANSITINGIDGDEMA